MCSVGKIVFLLCATLVVTEAAISSNLTRIRRQQNCDGFKCKRSGQCIEGDKECDGKVDCSDESDESNSCHRLKCQSFTFRCKYGACINSELECDGKKDCRDNSDETSPKCPTAASKCKDDEFQCSSGQCIPVENKCDGTVQCADGSDETAKVCLNIKCPRFSYKCRYGACVNGDAECNRIKECADGSDEDPSVCGAPVTPTPRPVEPVRPPISPVSPVVGGCVLPDYPNNGQWIVVGSNTKYYPGDTVAPSTVLNVSCHYGHIVETPFIVCSEGRWPQPLKCIKTCDPFPKIPHLEVECRLDEYQVDCSKATEGTVATFKCDTFYEPDTDRTATSRICIDGSWDNAPPKCIPVCGIRRPGAETLILEGSNATEGDWPWHTGLYKGQEKSFVCGGSLISMRVIVSAAHCVTNDAGDVHPTSLFTVAVGKYYREFNNEHDKDGQSSALKAIYVPGDYKGDKQNYIADIAVLITQKVFELTVRVQPVCHDWNGIGDGEILSNPNIKGVVVGWGNTVEEGKPSEVLKEIMMPYVPNDQCRMALPLDFDVYLTGDKMCAGYLNQGKGVCKGDSGGGLVFKHYSGRYYIRAVVSVAPKSPNGNCDSRHYGLFTRLHRYNSFIYQKERLSQVGI